jgi:protein SCO1
MGNVGYDVMRARHWIITALSGLAGFAAVALCIVYAMSFRGIGPAAGAAAIGGPFTLVDDTGATVTERTLAGKAYAMYFGYTFCPDICPTTLFDLSRWIGKLGPDADKLNYVFVTVDPERDTPKLMHAYLSSFDKHIRGFTGTPEEIAKIAREYRVYYKKVPSSDGNYVMDHSAIIYLMAPDNKFVTVIPYQEDDASALAKLKNLAALTPTS